VEESIRNSELQKTHYTVNIGNEDCVHGETTSMVWPTVGSRTAKEQNRIWLHYPSEQNLGKVSVRVLSFRRG